jgi:hypothetical protein
MKQSGISPTRIKDWSHRLTAFDKARLGGDNFRSMAVLLENIRFAPDECLRLLRWKGKCAIAAIPRSGRKARLGSCSRMRSVQSWAW